MELLEKILANPGYTESQQNQIRKAFDLAQEAHAGQKRLSGEAYIVHPLSAAYFLSEMGLDASTIVAALLHDTVEDTPLTLEDIEKKFGKDVAFLVDGVTKLKTIAYDQRLDSKRMPGTDPHVESLKKMFFAMAEDLRVILIKLADRLHNMQTLDHKSAQSSQRIALETMEIYAPIAARLGMGNLKGELEDLAFPHAYPEEYQKFMRIIKTKYDDRIRYIERVKPRIARHLADANIEIVDINSRVKHYWSLYQKMRRYSLEDAEKIYDLVAIRVIVPDIKSCYEALGIVHTQYKPLPGRVKDYIALPKPNGYKSLHTTVFCEKGRIAEIQIRTPEMHDHAENGIAAHWAYAESGKRKTGGLAKQQELAWINQLKTVLKDIKTKENLGNLKIDFFKYRIFALTPQGDVKDLPGGATPIDFAYAVHSGLGHSVAGARVNAKMVPLNYPLKNGDVVEIIKSKHPHPSLDWLNIATTTQAKKHIKTWFKNNDPTIAISNGRDLLNKELLKYTSTIEKLERHQVNVILKAFSVRTMDDLLTHVSMGDFNPLDIAKHAFAEQRAASSKQKAVKKPPAAHSLLPSSISIQGQTGLMYKLGKCCAPQSGDTIHGYVTRTKGVTIHLATCKNIKSADQERLLTADWK